MSFSIFYVNLSSFTFLQLILFYVIFVTGMLLFGYRE